ncbi:MAG: InlB B-repeat-containing protein [Butyrivibrio sp.]|uniref:InlB B-repeat-containing protein n=1 Tax=Butyrivibrio sp. TaxID=28121 RepID=UPI0025C5A69C|nr:InlB B-repeat-containing protein [Butyrivibrio sp.]MBQ6589388.1 InlB B-repeat-containing protein [Butyrivibrio sp.]
MKVNYRTWLAMVLSFALMIQAPVVAFAAGEEENGTPGSEQNVIENGGAGTGDNQNGGGNQDAQPPVDPFTTEAASSVTQQSYNNENIGYDAQYSGFNVYGMTASNSQIQTTYSNAGYETYVNSNENKINEEGFKYNNAYTVEDGVNTTISATVEGSDVLIRYEINNTTGESKTVKVGSAADTMIGDNDSAPVGYLAEGTGIYMNQGGQGGTSFALLPSSEEDAFTTLWYGNFGQRRDNVFNSQENAAEYSGDSGMAYSWTITVDPESTATRTAVFRIGNIVLRQITYDANEGEGIIAGTTVIGGTPQNVVVKVNDGSITKDGYDFAGWGTSADAATATYFGGETIDLGSSVNDIKLYALWQLVKATNPNVTIEEVVQMVQAEAVVEEAVQEVTTNPTINETLQTLGTEGINIITTQTGDALPTNELGNAEAVTRTISLDITKVTPAQYRDVVTTTVQTVPVNGVAVIETNDVSMLDNNIIEAMSSRPDLAINIVFRHDGVKKRVVIPPGYDVKSLLDENGYCGFLRLAAILGYTILE